MKTKKKKANYIFPFILFVLMLGTTGNAQGIIDGFYNLNGNLGITVSYTGTSYDEFYVGKEKTGPVPAHNKITQSIFSLYAKYGLSDNLTLILNLPYISASGDGEPDPVSGNTSESGFQDFAIAAKYKPFSAVFSGGKIDGIT
ncbi:MAG: hypothetical protein HKN31_05305, partial [Pricia sp.]|nr:hypothetical protein [Pricia sp.]